MDLSRKLREAANERRCFRLRTAIPGDNERYDGIVLHVGRDFVALREERDFRFDGLVFLRRSVLRGFRDDEHDECCNQILRERGVLAEARAPRWVRACPTLRLVLENILKRSIWPGIEIVYGKRPRSAFYLGPLTYVGRKSLGSWCYDAAGRWEKEYELPIAEVVRVEIDSQYINAFNAHMLSLNAKAASNKRLERTAATAAPTRKAPRRRGRGLSTARRSLDQSAALRS